MPKYLIQPVDTTKDPFTVEADNVTVSKDGRAVFSLEGQTVAAFVNVNFHKLSEESPS